MSSKRSPAIAALLGASVAFIVLSTNAHGLSGFISAVCVTGGALLLAVAVWRYLDRRRKP